MERDYSGELLRFIQEHPSVYHVIEGQRRILLEAGYEQLLESQHWTLREGGKYFLTRNHSALICISGPQKAFPRFYVDGQPQRFPRSEGQGEPRDHGRGTV